MIKILTALIIVFSAIALPLAGNHKSHDAFAIVGSRPGDTNFIPAKRYTKQELKKEKNDLRNFDKQYKEWQKAVKQKNADYLNAVFARTLALLEKEHSELSTRISVRSKEMLPTKKPENTSDDKPKVYNPELKDQIVNVKKEDILRKKAESEYLGKYINVIRNEKNIITQFKNIKPFDINTPSTIYDQISSDLKTFKKEMDEEIALMAKETGKKEMKN